MLNGVGEGFRRQSSDWEGQFCRQKRGKLSLHIVLGVSHLNGSVLHNSLCCGYNDCPGEDSVRERLSNLSEVTQLEPDLSVGAQLLLEFVRGLEKDRTLLFSLPLLVAAQDFSWTLLPCRVKEKAGLLLGYMERFREATLAQCPCPCE